MQALRQILLLCLLAGISAALVQAARHNLRPVDDAVLAAAGSAGDAAGFPESAPESGPELPELARFSEAFERPLFAENRRPPSDRPPELAVAEDRSLGVTLLGILYSQAERVVLLSPDGAAGSLRVAEGGEYRGWRLVEVRPNSAIFRQDDDTVELELVFKGAGLPADGGARSE